MAKIQDYVYDDGEEICHNKPGYWENYELIINPDSFISQEPFISANNDEHLFIGEAGKDMAREPKQHQPPMKELESVEIHEEEKQPLSKGQKAGYVATKEEAEKPHAAKMPKQEDGPNPQPSHSETIDIYTAKPSQCPSVGQRPPFTFDCTNGHKLKFANYKSCPQCAAARVPLVPFVW